MTKLSWRLSSLVAKESRKARCVFTPYSDSDLLNCQVCPREQRARFLHTKVSLEGKGGHSHVGFKGACKMKNAGIAEASKFHQRKASFGRSNERIHRTLYPMLFQQASSTCFLSLREQPEYTCGDERSTVINQHGSHRSGPQEVIPHNLANGLDSRVNTDLRGVFW